MSPPSFFAPVFSPTSPPGSFAQHGTARPPPHPLRSSSHNGQVSAQGTQVNPAMAPASPSILQDRAQAPRRCLPQGQGQSSYTQSNSPSQAIAIPLFPAVTLTNPTPIPSPTSAPPSYATPSPPKYAIIPRSNETALLLAPPPTFDESNGCYRCAEADNQCSRCGRGGSGCDWVVRMLIILNLIVWAMVIWGYLSDLSDGVDWDWGCGGLGGAGVGYEGIVSGCYWQNGDGAAGGGIAERCSMAFEDC